jgi:hypothetical protein
MLNPIVTLISGQVSHPFAGGVKAKGVTKKHRPLVWECMLGTVYAMKPGEHEADYFDYDYSKAHAHAAVAQCSDLRVCRVKTRYAGYPRVGQLALWGIPPNTAK